MKNLKTLPAFQNLLSFSNTAIFAVFFLLLPIIYTHQVFETASIPRHILVTIVACLLLLIYSFRFFISEIKIKHSRLHVILLVFLCWALLSSLWSEDIKSSITELTQLVIYFIIAFFASQLENNQIKKIFIALFIGSSLAAIIGILQAFNLNPLELRVSTALGSTFNNKNHASVFFDLVIPLALISMLTSHSYSKYIASITYTLAVTFILLARTKGSLLGYFIFTLFFLFFIYKNKSLQTHLLNKKIIIQYLFLSFLIPISIFTLTTLDFFETQTPTEWNAGITKESNSIRLSWYKNAYALLQDNPITGVGYGAFRKGFSPYVSNPNIVNSMVEESSVARLHNDPYQNILELGIVGGGLIILIFSYIIAKGSYMCSVTDINNKGSPNFLLLGIYLALVSSITHSFVDFPLRLPSSAALFWFITGISLLLINHKTTSTTIIKNTIRIPFALIFLLFSSLLTIHSYDLYSRFFSASKLAYKATVSFQKKHDCTSAMTEIDQAIDLFFEDHFIRHRYLQIYTHCDLAPEVKLSAMNRILNYDSTHNRARVTRASIYLDNRKLKLASADFKYLTLVLPHRPAAYLGLGDIATLKKEYTTARKYYEKAKILEPTNKKALFMLKQFHEKGI